METITINYKIGIINYRPDPSTHLLPPTGNFGVEFCVKASLKDFVESYGGIENIDAMVFHHTAFETADIVEQLKLLGKPWALVAGEPGRDISTGKPIFRHGDFEKMARYFSQILDGQKKGSKGNSIRAAAG
ncbi:hypothetical protein HYU14_06550 [Candidatus Woesearchaeota archaeon]|nr:hypothetical protein [Candidatus Woesearchaeota archaeon]